MEFDFENENQESLPGFDSGAATTNQDDPLFRQQSLEDSLASLYKPPYSRPREEAPAPAQPEPTSSIFPEEQNSLLSSYVSDESTQKMEEQTRETQEKKASLWPLLFLAIGSQLLTLGILLFFFSDNGTLTLQWNASRWFVYCLFSLPLIYFGYKQMNQPADSTK